MQMNETLATYQICVEGHLDQRWLRWFEGIAISLRPDGVTEISGAMDQSTLHGILNRIRDLSLVLISVQRSTTNRDLTMEGNTL